METEQLLTELADLCHETAGASFTVTRLKSKQWAITFPNSRIEQIRGHDLNWTLGSAIKAVKLKRKPQVATKYTLH